MVPLPSATDSGAALSTPGLPVWRALLSITDGFLRAVYAGRGPGGLVCSNRCIRNVQEHNMQAVDDTSEAVDVDGGLRATADEEKKYRP